MHNLGDVSFILTAHLPPACRLVGQTIHGGAAGPGSRSLETII